MKKKYKILLMISVFFIIMLSIVLFFLLKQPNKPTVSPEDIVNNATKEDLFFNGINDDFVNGEYYGWGEEVENPNGEKEYIYTYTLPEENFSLYNYNGNIFNIISKEKENGERYIDQMQYTYSHQLNKDTNFFDVIRNDIDIAKSTLNETKLSTYYYIHDFSVSDNQFYEIDEFTEETVEILFKNDNNAIEVVIENDKDWVLVLLIRPHENFVYEIYATYQRIGIK